MLHGNVSTKIQAMEAALDWLLDPAEDDIYTDADGEPV